MSVLNALKGIGGEFEAVRLLGALGTLVYIIAAHAFIIRYGKFDLTTYCVAFPGGLIGCIGGIAGGAAVKDRNVAVARVKQATVKPEIEE